jgi:hypothetical protein
MFFETVSMNSIFSIAFIDRNSLNELCSLCEQFSVFLQHPTWISFEASKDSFYLRCTFASWDDTMVTQFSISYHDSGVVLDLFSTKPVATRISEDDRALPPIRYLRNKELAERCTGQLRSTDGFDFDQAKKWFDGCRNNHYLHCNDVRPSGMRPKRLIDCENRRFADDVGQPYVCLSYVWGSKTSNQEESKRAFPHDLPSTIAGAMDVTLKIGLTHLWVDRYCIDQNNAEEKNDIIRNMDAICELTFLSWCDFVSAPRAGFVRQTSQPYGIKSSS